MMDFDERRAPDVAVTADGIRLRCRTLTVTSAPREMENASDTFFLILPLRHGRVRVNGELGFEFDGAVQPGTIRFVQPGEKVTLAVREEFERAILFVPGHVFRGQAEPAGFRIKDRVCPEMAPFIPSNYAIQRLVPLFEMSTGISSIRRQLIVQGLASTLLGLLLDLGLQRSQHSVGAFGQEQFEQVLLFAKHRLSRHLDLAEWAAAVDLPTSEFARRFQQHTGIAPYTWIMDRRVDLAKSLMTSGELSLVEIALEAGFCSQSHFTEAFRRRVGVPPGRWRKLRASQALMSGAGTPGKIDEATHPDTMGT